MRRRGRPTSARQRRSAGVLAEPAARAAFNRAVAQRSADSPTARRAGVRWPRPLPSRRRRPRTVERVAAYTARSPATRPGDAVAGAALASLLHNQPPDLAPILGPGGRAAMSQEQRAIRVPLNVDAQFRLAVGPMLLPVRSLILAASMSPVAYMLLALRLPGLWGVAGAGFVLAMAASFGLPERQGVWVGTHLAYRRAWRLLPSTIKPGQGGLRPRARGGGLDPRQWPAAVAAAHGSRPSWRPLLALPRRRADGARHPPARPRGPPRGPGHRGAARQPRQRRHTWSWCRHHRLDAAVDCPAQFLTLMTHHDTGRVGEAFDRRVAGWPRTPLRELERGVAPAWPRPPWPAPLRRAGAAVRRRGRHPPPGDAVACRAGALGVR